MPQEDLAIGACGNGLRNGEESAVDCGGPQCATCKDGRICSADRDCASRSCADGVCVSCVDGERNGSESDTDCGGSCPDCALAPAGIRVFYVGTNGRVILNDGAGRFHTGNSFPACMYADWASVGDLDRDGVPDALLACGRTLSVLRGDGSGGVSAVAVDVPLPGATFGVAVGDFNRDGRLDLAALTHPDGVSLVLNTSK